VFHAATAEVWNFQSIMVGANKSCLCVTFLQLFVVVELVIVVVLVSDQSQYDLFNIVAKIFGGSGGWEKC
jgi:hypothetical protein